MSAGDGLEGGERLMNSPRSGPGSQSMRPHYGRCPPTSPMNTKKSRVDWIAGLEGKRDTQDCKRQREGRRRGEEEGTESKQEEESRESEGVGRRKGRLREGDGEGKLTQERLKDKSPRDFFNIYIYIEG